MAQPFPGTVFRILDNSGNPVAGALVYTYEAGTTTPKAVYTDSTLAVAAANPVVADASGFVRFWLGSGAYKFRVTLPVASGGAELTAYAADNVTSEGNTRSDLALASGSSLVGFQAPSGTARTVQAKLRDLPAVTDYGAVADGTTDNSTAILTAAAAGGKVYVIPPNVKFNRNTVVAGLPAGVVLLDLSSINDFQSAGETTKRVGILSKDADVNDTHWVVESGHHAISTLNNYGVSGSVSAAERKASILWASGYYQLGSTDKRGFRGAVIQQFTKETGNDWWIWTMRSLAPWASINGAYEEWAQGQVIAGAGAYRIYGNNHYVSTGAGTTGATAPVHTTGTVSDGAVSWTWIDSSDRSIFQVDQFGRWLLGVGPTGSTWYHRTSITDPSGVYAFEGASRGVSKVAQLRLTPTDGAAALVNQPFLRAESGLGLRVMKSDASGDVGRFNDNGAILPLVATPAAAPTIASAATIAPTTPIAFVSGTTTISTITAPANIAATGGQITLIPTAIWATNTAGNIALATTAVVSRALTLTYDNATAKWYPSY